MKKNNKKGFTLAELLIVVAIIAVLAAIAIPVFSAQLQKAKVAADEANIRSWYAEVVNKYLIDPDNFGTNDCPNYNQVVTGYPALQAEDNATTPGGSVKDGTFHISYSADGLNTAFVIGKS